VVSASDLIDPVGVVFEAAGVEPGRSAESLSQRREALTGLMRVDAVDGADGREIAIGEVIGAARMKAGSQRRECGGPTARAKDQQIVRQRVKKSHLGERGARLPRWKKSHEPFSALSGEERRAQKGT
jgi:hypothetical protein